jgi:hypothetical protein
MSNNDNHHYVHVPPDYEWKSTAGCGRGCGCLIVILFIWFLFDPLGLGYFFWLLF